MTKIFTAAAVAATMAFGASQATAVTFTENLNGGDGSVVPLDAGAFDFALTIVSNDNGVPNIATQAENVAPAPGFNVTGVWNYSTQDIDGSSFDPFGYFIGTDFVQLSTDGIAAPAFQTGSFAFQVLAGQTWGFYALATDGILGRSSTSVFGNVTPIPLPAGAVLLLTALGGLAVARRRKSVEA